MSFLNSSLLKSIHKNKKSQFWVFFAVLVILTSFMMFCNGSSASYSGYDFYFHYRRLYTLIDALQHGTYISYIDYSNVDGYGYFTKGFYSDVILIPFALVGIFTSTYFAYDVMIFTMTVLCGIFMYKAVNTIYTSSYAASISGILYTFAVYRLFDIYQRGALAEALSFTFLPIIFLGLYYIIKGDYKKWYILVIGYALLIFTHVISSVLMFVTLLILLCVYYKSFIREPRRVAYLFLAGVITIALTAYYIFPTLEQILSNSFYYDSRRPGGGAGYGKVGFDILLWGFISGIAYPKTEIWTGIGIVLTLVVFSRFFVKNNKTEALKSVDIALIIGVCFIIAISRIFPWGRFPFSLLEFIQYPWRLYEFVSYFFALAGGYCLSLIFVKYKSRVIVFLAIILATMITTYIQSENFKYLYSLDVLKIYSEDSDETPRFQNRYHLIGGEYFPSKLPSIEYIRDRGEVVETSNKETRISNFKRDYNITSFHLDISEADTLVLPLLYYYGYSVTLNDNDLPVLQNKNGLIEVPVDQSGRVEAYYKGTTIQKISFYISIVSILVLSIFIIRARKVRKYEAIK